MSEKPHSNILMRVLTACILFPLIFAVARGGILGGGVIIIILIGLALELIKIVEIRWRSWRGSSIVGVIILPSIFALYNLDIEFSLNDLILLGCMGLSLWLLLNQKIAWVLGILIMLAAFSLIKIFAHPMSFKFIAFAILAIVTTDIGAYFGGRYFGGPKLASKISPAKTWSGAVCGILAAGGIAILAGTFFQFHFIIAVIAGIFIAIFSIIGDLFESGFKRHYAVKDSGNILPGHGGLLDRFDGFLIALPCFYIFLLFGDLYGK